MTKSDVSIQSLRNIAAVFGLSGERLNLIGGGRTSYVYEYQVAERSLILRMVEDCGDRYMLTCAETDYVTYLTNHGVNASRPIVSLRGDLTEAIEVKEGKFVVTVFERAPGKPISLEQWTPEIWEALGTELGTIHRLSRDYKSSLAVSRPQWHESEIMNIDRYIPKQHRILRDKACELVSKLKQLPAERGSYGLIHSDPNRGNMYAHNGRITLFDFEDCEYHWFVNDLAVALYFAVEDSFTGKDIGGYVRDFMKALIKGYTRRHHIDAYWLRKIPLFHKLRDLLTVLYFYADGGNSLGEHEIARATRSRINIEFDRPYVPIDLEDVINLASL